MNQRILRSSSSFHCPLLRPRWWWLFSCLFLITLLSKKKCWSFQPTITGRRNGCDCHGHGHVQRLLSSPSLSLSLSLSLLRTLATSNSDNNDDNGNSRVTNTKTMQTATTKPVKTTTTTTTTTTTITTNIKTNTNQQGNNNPLSYSPPSAESLQPYIDKTRREDTLFQTDDRVVFWRHLRSHESAAENARMVRAMLEKTVLAPPWMRLTPLQRAYWSSSILRTTFFGVNGLLSNWYADQKYESSSLLQTMDLNFRFYEILECYAQELYWVQQGRLLYPWDFVVQAPSSSSSLSSSPSIRSLPRIQWDHKQANPWFALQQSWNLLQEAPAILERRYQYKGRTSPQGRSLRRQFTTRSGGNRSNDSRPVMTRNQSNRNDKRNNNHPDVTEATNFNYPNYYLNDFHYQTDGWLSPQSADRYEMSSETIFIGSQDVMQRQTLLPLTRRYPLYNNRSGDRVNESPSSILEVGCGTGRFATFVRDHFPTAQMTLTDLSPFYLQKARENDDYWRNYRGNQRANSKNSMQQPPSATIVQANAEQLPFADESFDVVVCVYLFHELPATARANVAREMARVVKPGGMVVISDSIQIGDRTMFDPFLDRFHQFNEPHYSDYARTDLAALFTEATNGRQLPLQCGEKYVNSRTKTLSFIKPPLSPPLDD